MAKGKKTGGRKAGVPNKATAAVKEGILLCYSGIGGDDAFQQWARANPTEFYTKIYVKVLPLQLGGTDGEPLKSLTFKWQEPQS